MWGCLGPVLHDCWEAVGVFFTWSFKKSTLAAVSRIDSRKARGVQEDQFSQCWNT